MASTLRISSAKSRGLALLQYRFVQKHQIRRGRSIHFSAKAQCDNEGDFFGLKDNLGRSYQRKQDEHSEYATFVYESSVEYEKVFQDLDAKSFMPSHEEAVKRDQEMRMPFGFVRYDGQSGTANTGGSESKKIKSKHMPVDNSVENDKQVENTGLNIQADSVGRITEAGMDVNNQDGVPELGYIDEQFFQHEFSRKMEPQQDLETVSDVGTKNVDKTDLSFIDDQYIHYNNQQSQESSQSWNDTSPDTTVQSVIEEAKSTARHSDGDLNKDNINKQPESEMSFVDKQYFSISSASEIENKTTSFREEIPGNMSKEHRSNNNLDTAVSDNFVKEISDVESYKNIPDIRKSFDDGGLNSVEKANDRNTIVEKEIGNVQSPNDEKSDFTDRVFYEAKDVRQLKKVIREFQKKKKTTITGTAYDAVKELRQKTSLGNAKTNLLDSQGLRILKNQVPQFENTSSVDIVRLLRKGILYNDNDIVAINKPYGLPSHCGPDTKHSVGLLLDDIIPSSHLHLVHKFDKETTGVMLLAKTQDSAERLQEAFHKQDVKKRYLTITKDYPSSPKGVIDIPIAEGKVGDRYRMTLRPYRSPELNAVIKSSIDGKEAKTVYRVLDSKNMTSLIECIALTGNKHQIRVHLAMGLNCPVLGDHKYAYINKIVPMQLHPDTLEKLKIQQTKVRYLPMHLHARSVMIPDFIDGKHFFVSAPLPYYFVDSMRRLKLKLPAKMLS